MMAFYVSLFPAREPGPNIILLSIPITLVYHENGGS